MKGIFIEVINEAIQRRIGIPVTHNGYPWVRAQKLVEYNVADAFVTVPTPVRRSYTSISEETVVLATFTMFVNKDNPKLNDINRVKSISGMTPYTMGQYFGSGWTKKNLVGHKIKWVSSLAKVMIMLANDRFDIFIDTSQVVRYNVKLMNLQNKIVEVPNIIDSSPFNLCIGKDSPYTGILAQFDETIREMKADGTMQKIMAEYK